MSESGRTTELVCIRSTCPSRYHPVPRRRWFRLRHCVPGHALPACRCATDFVVCAIHGGPFTPESAKKVEE